MRIESTRRVGAPSNERKTDYAFKQERVTLGTEDETRRKRDRSSTLCPRGVVGTGNIDGRVPRVGSLGGQLYVLNMGISEDTAWMRHAGNRVTARPVFC